MRYFLVIFGFVVFLLLAQCKTQRVKKDLKFIVEEMGKSIPPENEAGHKEMEELEVKLNHGFKLYKAYCSGCHGVSSKSKDGIPDFSNHQLDNYSAATIRHDPENHAIVMKLSQDQISEILSFLYFRNLSKQLQKKQAEEK